MTQLAHRAMISRLSISQWTARKHDKRVSEQVAEDHNSSVEMGRYHKSLIAREALQAIQQAANEARTFHYAQTLPWMDEGHRILPADNYFPYTQAMSGFQANFDSAVDDFLASYAGYKEDARRSLNGLFQESDYPSESDIERRFGFDVGILPLPSATDFRVDINKAEQAKIRTEIEQRVQAAMDEAVRSLWQRCFDTVRHMADRLNAYKIVDGKAHHPFRDSLVDNLRELVELLPRLNITSDPNLAAMEKRLASELCEFDAQVLREDASLRKSVAKTADQILAEMAGYCG